MFNQVASGILFQIIIIIKYEIKSVVSIDAVRRKRDFFLVSQALMMTSDEFLAIDSPK